MSIDASQSVDNLIKNALQQKEFIPGETYIPVSGKVFDEQELLFGIESVLNGWWTEGTFAQEFEKEFSVVSGCRYVSLVNSGSSANLLALSALTSSVFGSLALKPGDEVITLAAGFPTTVNPIIQNGMTPVFIDTDLRTKNATIEAISQALTGKTRAIFLAHTLGNPMPAGEIQSFAKKHDLWFIEDCCDALGATIAGKPVGTFGDVATYSFYPAHQITMGEGGAVVTNRPLIHKSIRQFRDWGRDCWCDTGKDDTCRRRFDWKLGDLPYGYDHKYIYSQIGYNLKLTDMQAAIGLAQLRKLPEFVKIRQKNFQYLQKRLKKFDELFLFTEPLKTAQPSWFGFTIVINTQASFTKLDIVNYLEKNKIGTRSIFAGNLLRHPAYNKRRDVKSIGGMQNTDTLMNQGFWIGVYPGLTEEMLSYVCDKIEEFVNMHQ